ncbi:MAG TPA: hypothetical protein VNG29_04055 [Candidatus Paceibacterota bacterium]|nr:hypothetical protein [Candidatus Paceibacterota bacterium]
MEKILSFESGKEHYEADAFIAWCFDDRFSPLLAELKKGFGHSDDEKFAGGAKELASSDPSAHLDQIRKSILLHKTKRVVLMVHMDCGAYGGSKKFNNNHKAEQDYLASELNAAEQNVKKEFPDIEVEKVIADFDGLYKIDPKEASFGAAA